MIAKQVKGRGFRGCLNYLLDKEDSQIIGGNMSGQTPRQLAAEFRFSRQLNPRVQRAVYHASLSVPASEQLSDDQWRSLAADYLQGMGFDNNQHLIVRHDDTEHNHVHIVASRISLDGRCVSDSWDYRRSERLLRQLEQKYQLQPVQQRHLERRSPTTGEMRLRRRTGTASVREQIQDAIDQTCDGTLSLPQLLTQLREQGIEASVKFTRTGKVKGISYQQDGMAFSGTQLGKAYTLTGLQQYRGVDYQPQRDNPLLQAEGVPVRENLPKPDTHENSGTERTSRRTANQPISTTAPPVRDNLGLALE